MQRCRTTCYNLRSHGREYGTLTQYRVTPDRCRSPEMTAIGCVAGGPRWASAHNPRVASIGLRPTFRLFHQGTSSPEPPVPWPFTSSIQFPSSKTSMMETAKGPRWASAHNPRVASIGLRPTFLLFHQGTSSPEPPVPGSFTSSPEFSSAKTSMKCRSQGLRRCVGGGALPVDGARLRVSCRAATGKDVAWILVEGVLLSPQRSRCRRRPRWSPRSDRCSTEASWTTTTCG